MAKLARGIYNIVVLGAGGVGKSSLTIRFVTNDFIEDYDPTIEDFYRKQVLLDDHDPALLEILDTGGQEEFSYFQDQWMREGEGFLLVYSITSPQSLVECERLYKQILRSKEDEFAPPASVVLVGNKCDLKGCRRVTIEQASQLAESWNCPFFETSAKKKINIEATFYEAARYIRRNSVDSQSSVDNGNKRQKLYRKWKQQCSLL